MRTISAGLFISLDGVVEGPGDNFALAGWTMPYFSDEIGQIVSTSMVGSDGMVLGRKTYQGFQSAFGSQSGGMADVMNNFPKYVVSNTLPAATWKNSQLISGDVKAEITKLKQQAGNKLTMSGSGTLIQSLLEWGLLDELMLLLYPVTV